MNRKRLIDLAASDLIENEVWEYWMADNIEYVRASDKYELTEGSNVAYIVATDFVFKNGTKHIGYCTPCISGTLDAIQPVVLNKKGQVEFYRETEWTEDEKKKALAKFGYAGDAIFPATYKARIKYGRELLSGTLLDFNEAKKV